MTPEARHRAPFELHRFTATVVTGEAAILELEGGFGAASGRFARAPLLVVERAGEPRVDVAPAASSVVDGDWRATFAVASDVPATATFALAVGSVRYELPAPDAGGDGDGGDRLVTLAREANALRRRATALQHERDASRAAAADAAAARDEQERRTGRVADLETALAAAREGEHAADDRAERAERRARDAEAAVAVLRSELVDERARTQAELTGERARAQAELAEERGRAQAEVAALRQRADAEPPTVEVAGDPRPEHTRPAPLRPAWRARAPRAVASADGPGGDRGPLLSPWVAVVALGVLAVVVIALLAGALG